MTDKGHLPDNWLESSCSCLYAAAICKAVRLGLMEEDHLVQAKKAAAGVADTLREDEKGLLIGNICVGTGVGTTPTISPVPAAPTTCTGWAPSC